MLHVCVRTYVFVCVGAQDTLMDMLLPAPAKGAKNTSPLPQEPPKLDIKKDPKGMVTVTGATVVQVSARRRRPSAPSFSCLLCCGAVVEGGAGQGEWTT